MKYNKKNYSVRDNFCNKMVGICFVPFSGNGINICRRWELGSCPSEEDCRELLKKSKKKVLNKYDTKDIEFDF